jgi:hypothetical protein
MIFLGGSRYEITHMTWSRFFEQLYDKVAERSGFVVYRKCCEATRPGTVPFRRKPHRGRRKGEFKQ